MPDVSQIEVLPKDIGKLATIAKEENYLFLDRLIEEFENGKNTFSKAGEALFEVREQSSLIAIGALNVDPYASGTAIGRVRRFYVHPDFRHHGIGTLLIRAIECLATRSFSELHLRTDTTSGALFYAELGYKEVVGAEHVSHFKKL